MAADMTYKERAAGALYGMFIGDALAMPVHWYYDTRALKKDYGLVKDYLKPRNPHPDSILWRSSYRPINKKADILHDQSKFWGKPGIHYHQFLKAGENTLNVKLARELLEQLKRQKHYSQKKWLDHLVTYMTVPGSHNDTYVEEYLRHFFTKYGQGCELSACGRKDENHIGGLSLMLPLLMVFGQNPAYALKTALAHLALTHGGTHMSSGGEVIGRILLDILDGIPIEKAVTIHFLDKNVEKKRLSLTALFDFPDDTVVGKHFSSACYMNDSIPATLFLAMKYASDPESGLIANTMCGGDNAGRGAVLGALLGAAGGLHGWPGKWINDLLDPPEILFLNTVD